MRKTVVSLSRNQVVTLKRKVVVTFGGISNKVELINKLEVRDLIKLE